MSIEEAEFVREIEYACQEITNRYFSVEVAQGRFSDEPWWIEKIKLIEANCRAFRSEKKPKISWQRDFGKIPNSWDSKG